MLHGHKFGSSLETLTTCCCYLISLAVPELLDLQLLGCPSSAEAENLLIQGCSGSSALASSTGTR